MYDLALGWTNGLVIWRYKDVSQILSNNTKTSLAEIENRMERLGSTCLRSTTKWSVGLWLTRPIPNDMNGSFCCFAVSKWFVKTITEEICGLVKLYSKRHGNFQLSDVKCLFDFDVRLINAKFGWNVFLHWNVNGLTCAKKDPSGRSRECQVKERRNFTRFRSESFSAVPWFCYLRDCMLVSSRGHRVKTLDAHVLLT